MAAWQDKWESEDGSVTLYLGDAREIVPRLDESFDAVIADIPYGEVNRESGGLRNLDKGEADLETFPLEFVVTHSARLADSVYIWCGIEQVSDLRGGFVQAGMTTRLAGWEKTNPSPMNGERLWLSSFECCVFARKPKAWFGAFCESPIWRGPVERDQVHPTQKPDWLIRKLVLASVPPGGICLDFCMGSGTTGVSCQRTGRRFVGIEKHPPFFAVASKRIEEELGRFPLFDAPKETQAELFG